MMMMKRLDNKPPRCFEWIHRLATSLLHQEGKQVTDSFSDRLNEMCTRLESIWESIPAEFNDD